MSFERPSIVTLIEPSRIRVNFHEEEDSVVLFEVDAELGGVVKVPAADWPAIAKVVARHLRSRAPTS
jgi:hypothetical protein